MATKASIRKAIDYLRAAGLQYAPQEPSAILERVQVWLDALGQLDDVAIDHAARLWVSGLDPHDPQGRRGRVFPTPGELAELAPMRREGIDQDADRPQGCPDCSGSGGRVLVWVNRANDRLHGRRRAVLCDCARGQWIADQHRHNPEGVRMQTAREAAADIDRAARTARSWEAILWWSIPGAGQSHEPPADLAAELAQQAAEDLARERERARELRTVSAPNPRRVERAAAERTDLWRGVGV